MNQPFRSRKAAARRPFPRPYSTFSTINYYAFGSNSSYNAGTVTLRRRFGKGIFYRASYTLSKTIDDASNIAALLAAVITARRTPATWNSSAGVRTTTAGTSSS